MQQTDSDKHIRDTNKTAFEQLIGNTPLLNLKSASELANGCKIYGKAEFMNPGGSVKDRAAYMLIKEAENNGILTRGHPGLIIEGTAGNMGISLSIIGVMFGYDVIILMPDNQSFEKYNIMNYINSTLSDYNYNCDTINRSYKQQVNLVTVKSVPYSDDNHYIKIAQRLSENILKESKNNINKNSELTKYKSNVFFVNQWNNLVNQKSHFQTTGPEIWQQTNGHIDAFSCAVGTGGTLAGIGNFLRSVDDSIKICLTDPKSGNLVQFYDSINHNYNSNCGNYNSINTSADNINNIMNNININTSIAEGIGQKTISNQLINSFDYNGDISTVDASKIINVDDVYFKPDLATEIDDTAMLDTLQALQRIDGLMCGLSSGINVAGAIEIAHKFEFNQDNTIVTILCDSASRTASKQFNPCFLKSKHLPVPHWVDNYQMGNFVVSNENHNHEDVVCTSTLDCQDLNRCLENSIVH